MSLQKQNLNTPYFMIDERALINNLEKAKQLKTISGAKLVLALKCFSTWGTFDTIKPYLDGTTSSGPYEVKLGHETFGGETHAYSVGYSHVDIESVKPLAFSSVPETASTLGYGFDIFLMLPKTFTACSLIVRAVMNNGSSAQIF